MTETTNEELTGNELTAWNYRYMQYAVYPHVKRSFGAWLRHIWWTMKGKPK